MKPATPTSRATISSRSSLAETAMKVDFRTMTDLREEAKLLSMMHALYAEDESTSPVDQSRFPINIAFLVSHPSIGRIVLFRQHGSLCGYALLIPYWSNEFGGTLLFIDEIFIVPDARNKGIGRSFFGYLERTRPFDALALALETGPGNEELAGFMNH
jgi:GNAT superfamily N-acetyltransferase